MQCKFTSGNTDKENLHYSPGVEPVRLGCHQEKDLKHAEIHPSHPSILSDHPFDPVNNNKIMWIFYSSLTKNVKNIN